MLFQQILPVLFGIQEAVETAAKASGVSPEEMLTSSRSILNLQQSSLLIYHLLLNRVVLARVLYERLPQSRATGGRRGMMLYPSALGEGTLNSPESQRQQAINRAATLPALPNAVLLSITRRRTSQALD